MINISQGIKECHLLWGSPSWACQKANEWRYDVWGRLSERVARGTHWRRGGLRWGRGGCCGVPKWEIKVNSHHHKILLSNQLLFGPRLLRCGFKFLPCCVSGLFEGVALVSHEREGCERRCLGGGVATGLRREAPVAWLCLYSSHKLPAKLPDKLRWLSESDWAAERERERERVRERWGWGWRKMISLHIIV